MMLDKLTIKAQDAIAVAQQKAAEYNHQQIEPEHILKSMLADSAGIIPTIVKKTGVNMDVLDAALEHEIKQFPRVQGGNQQVYLSSRSQQVLNAATKFAGNLKDEFVSTEHLLLGMTQKETGNLAKILTDMGINEKVLLRP